MTTRRFASRSLCIAALLSFAPSAHNLAAQSVQPGTRLRVVSTREGVQPIAGQFARRTGDTLWLSRHDNESAMPVLLNANTRIDQSFGRSGKRVRGLIGGLVGLVIGSFVASNFTPKGCTGECDSFDTGEVVSAISVPLVFIPLGIYGGVKSARELWKPISEKSLSTGAAVGPLGVRFSAKFMF